MSESKSFTIKQGEEYIELIKLLKVLNIAESGALAQILVSNGDVKRNNVVELRKRAKIRRGETIEVLGQVINIE
ncbi:MAG: RNA-binding S4 domain-containing protein [Synergistales bacterium]|nr:RNA-binding S4 domain-containing protein [Bacteroidales bacterium]MDY6434797.1 RNA-binding S4 domain-containing protein [Synergistales bacterium]MBQ6754506.1 RNA-binding S4 domain-containing protein [Bacteroidales bacterium]MDY6381608.1 RNA-binding S4 domain-containing protein [Bacteroidales bacterium]MDY6394087.1 RNA-binding S4 domain-containing protein [Bacteroidales bacterium]